MIVFGGSPGPGAAPSDTTTWELRFDDPTDPNAATWRKLEAGGIDSSPLPAARVDQAMVHDPTLRRRPGTSKYGHGTFLYGGELASGDYSDTLWVLWNFEDGTSGWEAIALLDSTVLPGPRSEHTLTFDGAQGANGGRLYLFGGLKSDDLHADRKVYVLDPWDVTTGRSRRWFPWAEFADSVSGHTMLKEAGLGEPRVTEVFSPSTSSWDGHGAALLYQGSYPKLFVINGGGDSATRVLSAGRTSYRVDIPNTGVAGAWQETANGQDLAFNPLSGVIYRPDQILLAGGGYGTQVSDTCVTLDASDPDNNGWVATGNLDLPRANYNLVLLPNGSVMAVGGISNTTDPHAYLGAVKRPEIWDPETGSWSGSTTLEEQASIKNYHSTAVLLPDGRVLSAGGDQTEDLATADEHQAEIFCPPYLFNSSGALAERPVIEGTATELTYRQPFTICVPTEDSLTRAVLIRPAATTHSFDQNQRYVPLSRITKADNPPRLLVTAPAGPDAAPPGDYLLFLTGSVDSADVPSIATWVTLGDSAGADFCDVVDPGEVLPSPELISIDRIYFEWTASADDLTLAASGPSKVYRFRRSADPIHSEATWSTATIISLEEEEEIPDTIGTAQSATAQNLQSCTTYHFALRAEDDNQNLSAIHDTVTAKTLCSGGGGGDPNSGLGDIVNAETGETVSTGRREARRAGLSTQSERGGSAAALAVETESLGGGAWRFTLQAPAEFPGADASKMLRQVKDAADTWQTQSSLELDGTGARLGLCATGRIGRKVFPGTWGLLEIASTLRSPAGDLALVSAQHSSLGDLAQDIWSGDGTASLASGETLALVYEPSQLETKATEDWFALLQRSDASSSPTRDLALREGTDLPKTFALYQNQPNPFSHTTSIRFDLPKSANVKLTIYDIAGRKIRTLTSNDWPAGRHTLQWDHRSDAGVRLGAGMYIYRLTTDEYRSEKKMILLAR